MGINANVTWKNLIVTTKNDGVSDWTLGEDLLLAIHISTDR
jgi:hypothetical protein